MKIRKMMFYLDKILVYRRYIRYLYLNKILNVDKGNLIIDVGCGKEGRSYEVFNKSNRIIGIDIWKPEEIDENLRMQTNFEYIQSDATDMSIFNDNEFDVAFCIGVLEHIIDKNKLLKISDEIRRVSKKYAICVPWKYTPIEPHFKLPFFQLYSDSLQYRLIKKCNLNNMGNSSFNYFKSHYQWLSCREWKEYFPKCKTSLCPTITSLVIYK